MIEDKFLHFSTEQDYKDHIIEAGYPIRGRNFATGELAHESKQKTVRPFPIERAGSVVIMKVNDNKYTRRTKATELTKIQVQDMGLFPDPIIIN